MFTFIKKLFGIKDKKPEIRPSCMYVESRPIPPPKPLKTTRTIKKERQNVVRGKSHFTQDNTPTNTGIDGTDLLTAAIIYNAVTGSDTPSESSDNYSSGGGEFGGGGASSSWDSDSSSGGYDSGGSDSGGGCDGSGGGCD